MTEFIFYNEEWNIKPKNNKIYFTCTLHQTSSDSQGYCKKCSEEKNKKNANKKNIRKWR